MKRKRTKKPAEAGEPKKFRLQAKHIGLTYSQCDIPKREMFDWLMTTFKPAALCVSEEHHKDGGLHLHCYLRFIVAINTRNENYFDWRGFHASIEAIRHLKSWLIYIKKEDKEPIFTDNIEFTDSWEELADCSTREEYMAKIQKSHPREFQNNLQRIQYYVNWKYGAKIKPLERFSAETFSLPLLTDLSKAIVVLGPPLVGKTSWAASHFKNPMEIKHLDQFAKPVPNDVDGLIFDDMNFNHLPFPTVRSLINMNGATIHCRHTTGYIPPLPRFFTANKETVQQLFVGPQFGTMEEDAIILRTHVVYVRDHVKKIDLSEI